MAESFKIDETEIAEYLDQTPQSMKIDPSEVAEYLDVSKPVRQAIPVEKEDGYATTFGKGVVRGAEGMASGVGSMLRWGGDVIGSDTISQVGKDTEGYWQDAAQNGFAKPDEETFSGTFMENPSLKRAVGIVGEAVPSLVAAMATGGAAAAALRGAGMAAPAALKVGTGVAAGGLGLLEGAPQYSEARDAGKDLATASAVGTAATVGTALLEYLPISRILGEAGKGVVRGAVRGGIEEGVQESVQTVWQNLVAKVGYDESRELAEGIVESFIGGGGSGAVIGGVSGSKLFAAEEKAKAKGATDEELAQARTEVQNQVAAHLEANPQALDTLQPPKRTAISVDARDVDVLNLNTQETTSDLSESTMPQPGMQTPEEVSQVRSQEPITPRTAISLLDDAPMEETNASVQEVPNQSPEGALPAKVAPSLVVDEPAPFVDQSSLSLMAEDQSLSLDPSVSLEEDNRHPIDQAGDFTDTNPDDDAKASGEYQKGEIDIQGFTTHIENPTGSIRSGEDKNKKKWETEMQQPYGYLLDTVGKDGDPLDVFFTGNPESSPEVFVIDQVDPKTGEFDEHKIIWGAQTAEEAEAIYRSNYAEDWDGAGNITAMPMEQFQSWARDPEQTRLPAGGQDALSTLRRTNEAGGSVQQLRETAGEGNAQLLTDVKADIASGNYSQATANQLQDAWETADEQGKQEIQSLFTGYIKTREEKVRRDFPNRSNAFYAGYSHGIDKQDINEELVTTYYGGKAGLKDYLSGYDQGQTQRAPARPTIRLYSGIPVDEIMKLAGNVKAAMPHLVEMGREIVATGRKTFDQFTKAMKHLLGKAYESFKSVMRQIFASATSKIKEERGSVSNKKKAVVTLALEIQSIAEALEAMDNKPFGNTPVKPVELSKMEGVQNETQGQTDSGNRQRPLFESVSYGNTAYQLGEAARDVAQRIANKEVDKQTAIKDFAAEVKAALEARPDGQLILNDILAHLRNDLGYTIPKSGFDAYLGLFKAIGDSFQKYIKDQRGSFSMKKKGINISTRADDPLGRALTNPVWGSKKDGKDYFDVETEYKKAQSKKTRPELSMPDALRYDMNLMYKLQLEKFRRNPELVEEITKRGGVDFLKASEHTVGVKGSRWEGKGEESNFIRVLIKSYEAALKKTAPVQTEQSAAEDDAAKRRSAFIARMKESGYIEERNGVYHIVKELENKNLPFAQVDAHTTTQGDIFINEPYLRESYRLYQKELADPKKVEASRTNLPEIWRYMGLSELDYVSVFANEQEYFDNAGEHEKVHLREGHIKDTSSRPLKEVVAYLASLTPVQFSKAQDLAQSDLNETLAWARAYIEKPQTRDEYRKSKQSAAAKQSVRPQVVNNVPGLVGENGKPVYSSDGVNVLRKQGGEHFGNPFSTNAKRGETGYTVAGAVQAYEDWLNGTAHQNVEPKRRQWILDQIDAGKFDGQKILYYKDIGEHSHADALADFIENRKTDKPVEPKVEKSSAPAQKKAPVDLTPKEIEDAAEIISPRNMTEAQRTAMHEQLFTEQYRARYQEDPNDIKETVDFTDEPPVKDTKDYEDQWFPRGKEFWAKSSSGVEDKAKGAQMRELQESQGMSTEINPDAKFQRLRTVNQMESDAVSQSDALKHAGADSNRRMKAAEKNNETAAKFQETFWKAQEDALLFARGKMESNPVMTDTSVEDRMQKTLDRFKVRLRNETNTGRRAGLAKEIARLEKELEGRKPLMQIIGQDLAELAETFYIPDVLKHIETSKTGGDLATISGYPEALTELLAYRDRFFSKDDELQSPEATDEEAENAPRSIADRKEIDAEMNAQILEKEKAKQERAENRERRRKRLDVLKQEREQEQQAEKERAKKRQRINKYAHELADKQAYALFQQKDNTDQVIISGSWKGFFTTVAAHVFQGKVNDLKAVDYPIIAHKMAGAKGTSPAFRDLYLSELREANRVSEQLQGSPADKAAAKRVHMENSRAAKIVKTMIDGSNLLLPFEKDLTTNEYRGEVELPARIQAKAGITPIYTKNDGFIEANWERLDKILKDLAVRGDITEILNNPALEADRRKLLADINQSGESAKIKGKAISRVIENSDGTLTRGPETTEDFSVQPYFAFSKNGIINLRQAMNLLFEGQNFTNATENDIFDEMLHRSGLTALKGSSYPLSEFIDAIHNNGAMRELDFDTVNEKEELRYRELRGVRLTYDGFFANYEYANDVRELIEDIAYSDMGHQIAKERGFADRDAYIAHLNKSFRDAWPNIKNNSEPAAWKKKRAQIREDLYRKDLPLLKAARMERQYRDQNILDKNFFEKMVSTMAEPRMSAAEAYGLWIRKGNIGAVMSEIDRRSQQNAQAEADKNFAILAELRAKGARALALSVLTKQQQEKYLLAVKAKADGKKKAGDEPAKAAAPVFKTFDAVDRAALTAAYQLEQNLLAGREQEITDLKADHGLPVFPEDIMAAHVEKTFERRDEKSDIIDELKAQGVQTGTLRSKLAATFYKQVAKVFDAGLVIVSDPEYRSRYIVRNGKGFIVFNVQEDKGINRVFAHELFHHIVARADKAAYKQFLHAVKGMVGAEKWDDLEAKYGGLDSREIMDDEEILADLFSTVFTQAGFYKVLAETVPGKTLAQKLILRIMSFSTRLSQLFNEQSSWSYENTLLLGPSSMSEIHSLLGNLIKGMGDVRAQEDKYYTPFGVQTVGAMSVKLSPVMQQVFPNGARSRKDILDAVENAVKGVFEWLQKGARLVMADVGADKAAMRLANQLVFLSNQMEQKFDAVMGKHESVFSDYVKARRQKVIDTVALALKNGVINEATANKRLSENTSGMILEELHDDWSRGHLSEEQLKAKYPPAVHAAFAELKTFADEIAAKLKEIDPSFDARGNHFMQSIKWKYKDSKPFDDSFAGISERSKLEGDKNFLKTKDTTKTTRQIAEEGFEYQTIDPFEMAKQYLRDSYQYIAFHQMLKNGEKMTAADGKPLVKVFATAGQAHAAGMNPINDTGTQLMMKMNLAVGYRVKLKDGYLQENGSEQVYGTAEEAANKAAAYQDAFGEEAKVEAVQGQQRVMEGPRFMISSVSPSNERTELSKRFDTEEEAYAYVAERMTYAYTDQGNGIPVLRKAEEGFGTHTSKGDRLIVEKEKIAPETVKTEARHYFHPHLQRLLDRAIATNPLLTGSVGKVGKAAMKVKNEMTMWEFAFSLFHLGTITQEAMASTATYKIKRGEGLAGWLKSFNPGMIGTEGVYKQANRIATIFDVISKEPALANDPAVKKEIARLFGTDSVDVQEMIDIYPLVGGLMHMDTSLQASTHSMGKMRYRKQSDSMAIENGQVVYKADKKLSMEQIKKSIADVHDKFLAENPDAKWMAKVKAGRFALAEGTAAWLMNYAIPRIKLAMWAREYSLALDKNKAKIEAGLVHKQDLAHETMKFIEDRFGEVNWQNMWLEPSVKTALQLTFRSFTWVFGNFTGLAKAGTDITKWGWFKARNIGVNQYHWEKETPAGIVKSTSKPKDMTGWKQVENPDYHPYELTEKGWWGINAFVGHMLTVGAMTALYQMALALSGDDEAPDDEGTPLISKILFPRMDPTDPAYRLQFGSYVTESYKIFAHMGSFGNDVEVTKLFSGRLSSFISQGMEAFYYGTDWRGVKITEEDDMLQTVLAKQLFHTFKFAPISVSSFTSQMERKGFEADKVALSFAGFTEAPASAKRSAATNAAFAIRRKENPGKPIEEDKMEEKDALSRAVHAYANGDRTLLDEMIREGKVSPTKAKNAIARIPLVNGKKNPAYIDPLAQAIKGLTMDGTFSVWEKMTPEEKKKHRPRILEKYRNMMGSKTHSIEEKKEFRSRMLELGIL